MAGSREPSFWRLAHWLALPLWLFAMDSSPFDGFRDAVVTGVIWYVSAVLIGAIFIGTAVIIIAPWTD